MEPLLTPDKALLTKYLRLEIYSYLPTRFVFHRIALLSFKERDSVRDSRIITGKYAKVNADKVWRCSDAYQSYLSQFSQEGMQFEVAKPKGINCLAKFISHHIPESLLRGMVRMKFHSSLSASNPAVHQALSREQLRFAKVEVDRYQEFRWSKGFLRLCMSCESLTIKEGIF